MSWFVPAFILQLTLVQMLCDGLARFDHDLTEGDFLPPGWIRWGSIRPMRAAYPVRRYFFLKLPSYDWRQRWDSVQEGWHQLTLVCIAGRWHWQYTV